MTTCRRASARRLLLRSTRCVPLVNPLRSSSEAHPYSAHFVQSAYWAPQLYYINPVGPTYQAIPNYARTYYLQRPGNKNEKIMAFPKGLRMIAGNPNRRTYDGSSFADQAVSFVCLDYYNSHSGDPNWEQRNNFFPQNCPDGMRAQVFFPSCWNGIDLDSADHKSRSSSPQSPSQIAFADSLARFFRHGLPHR